MMQGMWRWAVSGCFIFAIAGCRHHKPPTRPEKPLGVAKPVLEHTGDEIVVCGQMFDTGTPIVLWTDPGGYHMYGAAPTTATTARATTTTTPSTQATQRRMHTRTSPLTDAEVERVRREGWTLPFLQKNVDQFVIHYDVAGVSRNCFRGLKSQGLGVQFMLDIDGTIYQTMDLQESAAHATIANSRSIGVEIANMGAYSGDISKLLEWYETAPDGSVQIKIPERAKGGGVRTPNFVGGPARRDLVTGVVQGATYRQYDFTPQQYDALIKLTAALCTVFPKIQCDYPRQKTTLGPPTSQRSRDAKDPLTKKTALAAPNEPGELIPHTLTWEQYDNFQGLIGHYHVQTDKQDPGPAFQWAGVVQSARNLMSSEALEWNRKVYGKPAKLIPSKRSTQRSRGRGGWRRDSARSSTSGPSTQPATTTSTKPGTQSAP
jgi:N-acetylmuramoyl-L-alanine amidase